MKKALFNMLSVAGLGKILRAQKKNKLTVLSLHRISFDEDFFWGPIKPGTFETLLKYLVSNYSIISFNELSEIKLNKQPLKPYLILSFDDGYYDFYEHALPLLVKYKLPSNHNIVNVCADSNQVIWTQRLNALFNYCRNKQLTDLMFYDNDIQVTLSSFNNNWMQFYLKVYNLLLRVPLMQRIEMIAERENLFPVSTQVRMMNWNEILECSRNNVEIGCHTYNHDVLSTITDSKVLYHEIVESAIEIEKRLGKKINVLALPNGQGNNQVTEMAKKAGIHHVLYVGDKVNEMANYTDQNKVLDTYRVNLVEETMPEMILRTELFHSKLRKYA